MPVNCVAFFFEGPSPVRLPERTVLFEVAPYAVLGEVRTVRGMTYPVVRVKRERDVPIPRHRDSKCFEKQRVYPKRNNNWGCVDIYTASRWSAIFNVATSHSL